MCYLTDLVVQIEAYLTGNCNDSNIIKRHSRKLDTLGDLSFPSNVSSWKRIINVDSNNENHENKDILTYAQKIVHKNVEENPLDAFIKSNDMLKKCVIIKNHFHIFLDRLNMYKVGIKNVLSLGNKYGMCDVQIPCAIKLSIERNDREDYGSTLNELRVMYLKSVIENLLNFVNKKESSKEECLIEFSLKAGNNHADNKKVIYCGPVLNENGVKNSATAEEYFQKRAVDMRLMAEHKYGLRVTSQSGWKEIFHNLGESSVIIELLQNTPSHSTVVSLSNSSIGSVKGAPFIMYNGARMTKLLKEFESKVSKNLYPPLPSIENINFELLNQPEEWELFFVYILQFPQTIHLCICDIHNGRINPHVLIKMLSNMVNVFSQYYRRVKILTDPHEHLFPVLHARIYLLKCLLQVFYNSMTLLNIKPVTQM